MSLEPRGNRSGKGLLQGFRVCDMSMLSQVSGLLEQRLGKIVGSSAFFFHEYGRHVGMVPRSSLKEGKYNQMVEKRTKKTQQQTKPTKQPQTRAHRPSLHHLVVFPLC